MQNELLSGVNPVYCKGGFALCDNNWHYSNIVVGYDQIYYIIEGECVIEIDGVRHIAKPGQMWFLPSRCQRTLYTQKDKTVKKYWMHCLFQCGEKIFSDFIKLPLFIEVDDGEAVENLFKSILAKSGNPSLVSKLEQKADILHLLAYYIQNSGNSKIKIDQDAKISWVINYIDNNLTNHLTVEQLSEMLHFNPSYFIRYFKAATGVTPMHYINNQRVLLAQKLLLDVKIPIHEVGRWQVFKACIIFLGILKRKQDLIPRITADTP